MKILVIDVGGTHVKFLVSGLRTRRAFDSGPTMKPAKMVEDVKRLTADWSYDKISIGYPGLVVHGRIAGEPKNLGRGWLGFDFGKAFGVPVKIVNDAAMQALGSYEGGRMLFLGLGTGLGGAMVVDGEVVPMEVAHLPYKKGRTYEDYLGARGLKRLGTRKWRKHALSVIAQLRCALEPDDVVIGGGNASRLGELPEGARLGQNANAFAGGFRLWSGAVARARRPSRTTGQSSAAMAKRTESRTVPSSRR
jgi:polyphosphate glucokinase